VVRLIQLADPEIVFAITDYSFAFADGVASGSPRRPAYLTITT
jgi:hypothetical protein